MGNCSLQRGICHFLTARKVVEAQGPPRYATPSASAWSPSPDLAVWLHLLGRGRVCSGESWI